MYGVSRKWATNTETKVEWNRIQHIYIGLVTIQIGTTSGHCVLCGGKLFWKSKQQSVVPHFITGAKCRSMGIGISEMI